ncbi:uncharacterized protein DS421_17g589170 [Arachis hypogaea]|nr:uncharacterized protein DS421_17g589170 [Arachis hypogaea]
MSFSLSRPEKQKRSAIVTFSWKLVRTTTALVAAAAGVTSSAATRRGNGAVVTQQRHATVTCGNGFPCRAPSALGPLFPPDLLLPLSSCSPAVAQVAVTKPLWWWRQFSRDELLRLMCSSAVEEHRNSGGAKSSSLFLFSRRSPLLLTPWIPFSHCFILSFNQLAATAAALGILGCTGSGEPGRVFRVRVMCVEF